jgi:hypothetical protein
VLSSLREFGTPLEFLKFPLMTPSLAAAPRGDGRKVVLIPGFTAPEFSMRPLALYLRYLGYEASTWGLGVNGGEVDHLTGVFGRGVQDIAKRDDEPVTLIGWSLGGVIARETARLFSPSVREVITMGTPLIGGPKYTSIGAIYARREGLDMDAFEREVHERNSIGLSQPLTVIYSKSDGIVGWQAARDVYNDQARNIVVRSTHFGMGASPVVWKIVANTLAGRTPV